MPNRTTLPLLRPHTPVFFSATLSANIVGVNSVLTKVPFSTIIYQMGGNYFDPIQSTFTSPGGLIILGGNLGCGNGHWGRTDVSIMLVRNGVTSYAAWFGYGWGDVYQSMPIQFIGYTFPGDIYYMAYSMNMAGWASIEQWSSYFWGTILPMEIVENVNPI